MSKNPYKLYEHPLYKEDLAYLSGLSLPWELLDSTKLVLSGASGMLGSLFVDTVMIRNECEELGCTIYALGRSKSRLEERFLNWQKHFGKQLRFVELDIDNPLDNTCLPRNVDYVVHFASNTHPVAYASDPVGTVLANIYGTKNMLDFAIKHKAKRFAFASSNEIYGENRGDVEKFNESYCGYIDCNTLRAGYPESKRCGEALCQAYLKQYDLDVVIPRFTRSYGPTLLPTDIQRRCHNSC